MHRAEDAVNLKISRLKKIKRLQTFKLEYETSYS